MKDERENMEWINEYQTLKQVDPANPFVVPANYFNEMQGQIMDKIRLDEFKTSHPKQEFTVPDNYFNELEQNIQSRIAIDEVLNNEKGFTIPEGYFDELEQNIQSRIAIAQNIEEEFAVPEGYFEALTHKILAKTTLQPAEKIVKEERGTVIKLWTKHAFKYASAACFSLVIGTGLFLSEFNTTSSNASHKHSYLHKAVAKMSNDEIEAYLQLTTDVPSIIDNSDLDGSGAQTSDDTNQVEN